MANAPCFPPVSTVLRWLYLWLWLTINHALLIAEGREVSPSAGVIDNQSVKRRPSWI